MIDFTVSNNDVSSGDIVSTLTISSGDAETMVDTQTIWTKPISDYTVTESFLFFIFLLCLVSFLFKIIGGKVWAN